MGGKGKGDREGEGRERERNGMDWKMERKGKGYTVLLFPHLPALFLEHYKLLSNSLNRTASSDYCAPLLFYEAALIKPCTLCPSVSPVDTIFSKSARHRNFKIGGDTTLETSNSESKIDIKRSRSLGMNM